MARAADIAASARSNSWSTRRLEDLPFVFIEANPRLQVEHTVTEEVTGLDLVRLQIAIAGGSDLASLGLDPGSAPAPRGYAIQWRVNVDTPAGGAPARPGRMR